MEEENLVPEARKEVEQQQTNESTKDWIKRAFLKQQLRNDAQHTSNITAAQVQHGVSNKDGDSGTNGNKNCENINAVNIIEDEVVIHQQGDTSVTQKNNNNQTNESGEIIGVVHTDVENTRRKTQGKEIVAYQQSEDWGDATYVIPLQIVAPVEESFPPANTLQLGMGEVNEMESKLQAIAVLHAIVTHQVLLEKGQTTNQDTISREDSNEGDDEISREALKFYTEQFTETDCIEDYSIMIKEMFGDEICQHVNTNLGSGLIANEMDKPWWMPNSKGNLYC
ncbi:hypothetical protein R3W88_001887 [Solanum pinnatisectum]|uniref:Uncharacterized protein n=1 Tax=Solanum pinnatisectum TaxID=50273 RepID=A0AAV9MJG8_9SOLN|nr:hypothetical protein R3W88_001887 [Solanum pinnatisectum]